MLYTWLGSNPDGSLYKKSKSMILGSFDLYYPTESDINSKYLI